MADGNAGQIAYWNDRAAATWTAFQDRIDAAFAGLTEAAVAAAAPAPGERVIDVGCGCGATVLELARKVGPDGFVLGLDVSVPMAARARARIAAEGLGNAEIVVADASVHALPPGEADLLFSRFGVMFFDDPQAAFAALRRAMRPGGRMLFAAWRALADNPWFDVPLKAARDLLPPQPPAEPHAPGPFAFAEEARVRAILDRAGWREVRIGPAEVRIRLAGSGELDRAAEFATSVGGLARMLVEAEPDVREAARGRVREALASHDGPDGVRLDGAIWLISARA
jgi:SAM-dependent methyltransferase